MKYIKQFEIILLLSFIGELLNHILPLPIPASIYGLILLFILLNQGVVSVVQVKQTGDFLLDIMSLLFVPAGVGLISYFSIIKNVIVKLLLIVIISTIVVMVVSGIVTQQLLKHKNK